MFCILLVKYTCTLASVVIATLEADSVLDSIDQSEVEALWCPAYEECELCPQWARVYVIDCSMQVVLFQY